MKRQNKKVATLADRLAMAYIMSLITFAVFATIGHAPPCNDETPKRPKARKKPTAAKK